MAYTYYEAKGTMKIKDADGHLHPFYPKTNYDSVWINYRTRVADSVESIKANVEQAESRSCIEPMHVEPTDETTKDFQNETLIAWYGDPAHDSKKYMKAIVSTDAMSSPVKVVGDIVTASVTFINDGNAAFNGTIMSVPAFRQSTESTDISSDPFQNVERTIVHAITEADVLAALANNGNLTAQEVTVSNSGDPGTIDVVGDVEIYLNVYEDNLIQEKYNPFLTITRTGWNSANINEQPYYQCSVANTTQTFINDVLLASTGTGWTETVSFEPGETKQFTITYPALTEAKLIELNGTLTDTFNATGTSFANTPINVSRLISVDPKTPTPKLAITVLSDGKSTITQDIAEGGNVDYVATVTNNGNVTVVGIEVQITPTIEGVTGTAETVAVGTLAPGESSTISRSISIPAEKATSTIVASMTAGTPAAGSFTSNASGTLTVKQTVYTFKFKAQTLNNKISIPFDLYNNSYSINVDWGDGTTQTLTRSSYAYSSTAAAVHTYSTAGEYTISVSSNNWNNIYFDIDSNGYATTTYTTQHIYYFIKTVTEILSPIPNFYATRYQRYNGYSYRRYYNNNTNYFGSLFYNCTRLSSISSNLFAYNSAITSFYSCFNGCSSLASIPSNLFANNTAVTSFGDCFRNCTSLQSIPSGLFDKNTAVTNFSYCFYNCTTLIDFDLHIGSTKVSSTAQFASAKSGTVRRIYVPSGSTTQTYFNNVASSLGLTIIGE